MSGWFPMDLNLQDKPEFLAVRSILKIDADLLVGKLWKFWGWFDSQSEDGFLPFVSGDVIDERIGVPGFAQAMVRVEWLTLEDHGARMPGFEKRHSNSEKKRMGSARRMAKSRGRQIADDRNDSATEAQQERNTNATEASPTRQDKTRHSSPNGERSAREAKPARDSIPLEGPGSFKAFYAAYPKKSDPKDAEKAFQKVVKELSPTRFPSFAAAGAFLAQRASAFARAPAGQRGNFTKGPAPWLRAGAYDSDDSAWQNEEGRGDAKQQRTFADRTGPSREYDPAHVIDPDAWSVRSTAAS